MLAVQPKLVVNVITVVPTLSVVKLPVAGSIVATPGLLLVQVPDAPVVSVYTPGVPRQRTVGPVIIGNGLTVIVVTT
jgi:hypothetical protein